MFSSAHPQGSPSSIFWCLFHSGQQPWILPALVSVLLCTFNSIACQPIFIDHLWCARPWAIIIRLRTHSSTLTEVPLIGTVPVTDRKINEIESLTQDAAVWWRRHLTSHRMTRLSWKHKRRGWGPQTRTQLLLSERGMHCIAQCLASGRFQSIFVKRTKSPPGRHTGMTRECSGSLAGGSHGVQLSGGGDQVLWGRGKGGDGDNVYLKE